MAIRVSKFKVTDWQLLGFLIEKGNEIGLKLAEIGFDGLGQFRV